jgi:hypothetical protein
MMSDDIEYGLRHDPTDWIKSDDSLAAARVRTMVYRQPLDGDERKLNAKVDEILAGQRKDGSLGASSKATAATLLEALEHGAAHDRPEVQRAAEAVLGQLRAGQNADVWFEPSGKALSIYAVHVLCLLGRQDEPEVTYTVRWLVEHPEVWNNPWEGCPWTPAVFWSALWAARAYYGEVEATVRDGLRQVTSKMNEAGCCAYNDPWGFTDAAGQIDVPEARALVEKQIPLILRSQHPDGGFGGVSFPAIRALEKHGFLDRLRDLPPLAPEWRTVREVPLPEGMWFSLTWDGQSLWSFNVTSREATAISPADGRVLRRVGIDNCHAVAWWDGALAAVGTEPKELKKVDLETCEVVQTISLAHMESIIDPEVVAGQILVGDRFLGCVSIIHPDGAEKPRMQCLAGPFPACLAADGEDVWHADRWAPAIIKSDLKGRLLDWGGKPFGIQGLAFDGQQLWALDGEARRICAIEKVSQPAAH